jgi:hypothetical protein
MQQKVQVLGTGVDVSLFGLLVGPARCSNGLSNKGLIVAAGTVRIPMVASPWRKADMQGLAERSLM